MKLKKCNICGKKVDKFLPITDHLSGKFKEFNFPYSIDSFETLNHKAYECPNCGSADRDRLLFMYLNKMYNSEENYRILEFAPSEPLSKAIKGNYKNSDYRTADLYMKNVDDKGVDICNMKKVYKNNSFDIVICSHILEHVKNDIAALKELKRIIKNSGVALVLVPIIDSDVFDEDTSLKDTSERWRRFAQDDHVRLYSKKEFTDRIKTAGLKITQFKPKSLTQPYSQLNGVDPKSVLYVLSKK